MPALTAPARPAHRGPVLAALMVAMALSAMDSNDRSRPRSRRWCATLGGFSLFSWVFSSVIR